MRACVREANRQSKRLPHACVNFSLSSTPWSEAELHGLLQTHPHRWVVPVDFPHPPSPLFLMIRAPQFTHNHA